MEENLYKASLASALAYISHLINVAEDMKLTNKQYFLNWLDSLNELSIKY